MKIVAYITGHGDRVVAGSPLALRIEDARERQDAVAQLGKALLAEVVQLECGDYVLIQKER